MRPSVFFTWMSNCASAAVSAMSTVATSCVALTYLVFLTLTPVGSVVPVLKNCAFAPFLKFLPPIVTLRPSVPWSPDGGLAEVTEMVCAEAAGTAPPQGRPSITATSTATTMRALRLAIMIPPQFEQLAADSGQLAADP